MNKFDIKRLGLIFAVQAEIEGMKSANAYMATKGGEPIYNEYSLKKSKINNRDCQQRRRGIII